MNLYEFGREIYDVYSESYQEWDKFVMIEDSDDPNYIAPEDKFEGIATAVTEKVLKIATRTRSPKALLADNLLEIIENYIDAGNKYDDIPIMGSVARMMAEFCSKLLNEAKAKEIKL